GVGAGTPRQAGGGADRPAVRAGADRPLAGRGAKAADDAAPARVFLPLPVGRAAARRRAIPRGVRHPPLVGELAAAGAGPGGAWMIPAAYPTGSAWNARWR